MATILVIDDDRVSRRVLSFVLRRGNHITTTAHHGREVQQRLQEAAYDLALASVSAPYNDGLALLWQLRAQDLPVLVLSDSAREQDRQLALSAGADGFLMQPISSQELLDTVAELVGRRRFRPAAPPRTAARAAGAAHECRELERAAGAGLHELRIDKVRRS